MRTKIEHIDERIILFLRRARIPFARGAIFVVFFWFGALKVAGTSAANPLVANLLKQTLPFISFQNFIIFFGLYEMLIGVLFLITGYERVVMPLLFFHMFTTALPLVLLPQITWQSFLTPTLEGQYIIKNCLIIALSISIAAGIKPLKEKRST